MKSNKKETEGMKRDKIDYPVTKLLQIYKLRIDLQNAFPEVIDGDLKRLLEWVLTSGLTIDSSKNDLLPYKDYYRTFFMRFLRVEEKVVFDKNIKKWRKNMTSDLTPSDIKLDLGCGNNKKRGYIGIDIQNFPDVDYILDVTTERLPFEDNSVSEVYSSHLFEHFDNPEKVLKEIIRVCRHRARVQIWTPHLWANDAFVLGHRVFYNEASWRHICIYHPDIWQRGTKGRLVLECFKYVLTPDITDNLEEMRIPLRFALNHFSNIAFEFCAEMTVYKKGNPHLKNPVILTSYSRNGTFLTLEKEDFSIKI